MDSVTRCAKKTPQAHVICKFSPPPPDTYHNPPSGGAHRSARPHRATFDALGLAAVPIVGHSPTAIPFRGITEIETNKAKGTRPSVRMPAYGRTSFIPETLRVTNNNSIYYTLVGALCRYVYIYTIYTCTEKPTWYLCICGIVWRGSIDRDAHSLMLTHRYTRS